MSTLSTANPGDDGQSRSNIYNAQELEDVDESLDVDNKFYVVAGNDVKKGHVVNLSGRQFWFNVASIDASAPTRLCLRHDVDGVVWQPETENGD